MADVNTSQAKDRTPTILLIEDNPGDATLVTEAMRLIRGDISIVVATDGQLGLEQLASMDAGGRLPDLIVCNFNLPKRTGAEVLAEVQRDARLKQIPFIMLTSSNRDADHRACAGAKAYLIKGDTWDDTLAIAKQIIAFLPDRVENVLN